MTNVFVEQPLALPGSANCKHFNLSIRLPRNIVDKKKIKSNVMYLRSIETLDQSNIKRVYMF